MLKTFRGLMMTAVATGLLSAPVLAQPATTQVLKNHTLQISNSNPSKEIKIHRVIVGFSVGPVKEINPPAPVGLAPNGPSLPGLGEFSGPGSVRYVILKMQLGSSKLIECKYTFGAEGTGAELVPIGDANKSFNADGTASGSCGRV